MPDGGANDKAAAKKSLVCPILTELLGSEAEELPDALDATTVKL